MSRALSLGAEAAAVTQRGRLSQLISHNECIARVELLACSVSMNPKLNPECLEMNLTVSRFYSGPTQQVITFRYLIFFRIPSFALPYTLSLHLP